MTTSSQPLIGRKYELVRKIGEGAMGTVYEAVNTRTQRRVALKVLKEALRTDREASRRFVKEAMVVGGVEHPGIVQVYDASDGDDALWIAMELLRGQSLRDRLKAGPLSDGEVHTIFSQLLDALAAVHRHGIVHRDLKPDNVFLARPSDPKDPQPFRVKVLDFGIAKIAESVSQTASNILMGTPEYMAPEQLESARSVDARADLYSVGVMLYQCLARRLPYEAGSLLALIRKITLEPPEPLVCPAALRHYEPIALACLEKEPSRRPASAEALGRMFETMSSTTGRSEPATVAVPRSRRWIVLAAVLVAVLTASIGLFWPRPAPAPATTAAASPPRVARVEPAKPVPGSVTVRTDVDGGVLVVDGDAVGPSNEGAWSMELAPGVHQFDLYREGSRVSGSDFILYAGASETLWLDMPKDAGAPSEPTHPAAARQRPRAR